MHRYNGVPVERGGDRRDAQQRAERDVVHRIGAVHDALYRSDRDIALHTTKSIDA